MGAAFLFERGCCVEFPDVEDAVKGQTRQGRWPSEA